MPTRLPRFVERAILAFVAAAGMLGGFVALGIGEKVSAVIFGAAAAAFFSGCGTLAWKALDAFRDALKESDALGDREREQMRHYLAEARFSVFLTLVASALLAAGAGACWVLVHETDVRTRDAFAAVYVGFSAAALLLPLMISLGTAYFSADVFVSRIRDRVREQRAAADHLAALAGEKSNLSALSSDAALTRYQESIAH